MYVREDIFHEVVSASLHQGLELPNVYVAICNSSVHCWGKRS